MTPTLSILICTIPGREGTLARLMAQLKEQSEGKAVEILIDARPKANTTGGVSVGTKRQALLEQSTGKYVCYIDDDDTVADDYIDTLLSAAKADPDCIGFKLMCHFKNNPCTAVHSIRYAWKENVDGFRYVRSPHHLTPVKREIAIQVGFNDKRSGEDRDYSNGLVGKLKSEVFIDRHLYNYLYLEQPAHIKYGIPKNR